MFDNVTVPDLLFSALGYALFTCGVRDGDWIC